MMSNYLKTYTVGEECSFQDGFLKDEYLSSVFAYAVSTAIDAFGSYWNSESAQGILKEDTFNYIWNAFPEKRSELFEITISSVSRANYGHRIKSLSEPFCKNFLTKFYENTPVDDKTDTNTLRAKIVSVLDDSFDYLSELHRFSLIEEDEPLYRMWERCSLSNSKDKELYDYLWSQVKRGQGAVDKKDNIVRSAIENAALSDSLIGKIAKSSPKRIKRIVVEGIRTDTMRVRQTLRGFEASAVNRSDEIERAKKIVAKLEARAMLFIGCDDYKVVECLMDCLSRDNLPWLLPSASRHAWLGERINRLLEEDDSKNSF
jgi:hypothetical protein